MIEEQQNLSEKMSEIVVQVDDNNNVLGQMTRKEMREKNLFHRATMIFVINSQKQIYVHLRHQDKKWAGNCWTTCFGGCVGINETYDSNAVKELEEEAGISNCALKEIFDICYNTEEQKNWSRCYIAKYDGDLTIQKEEVQKYELMSFEQIQQRRKQGNFAPDTLKAFDLLIQQIEDKQIILD